MEACKPTRVYRVVVTDSARYSIGACANFDTILQHPITRGAFHSTKIFEISGPKLNGTGKVRGEIFENLGIRFQCTLFDGISRIIETFVFHSRQMSVLVSQPSASTGKMALLIVTPKRSAIIRRVLNLPHPTRTAVFTFQAKLQAAQMSCPVELVRCALFLASTNRTFPWSSGNGSQTPPTNKQE